MDERVSCGDIRAGVICKAKKSRISKMKMAEIGKSVEKFSEEDEGDL